MSMAPVSQRLGQCPRCCAVNEETGQGQPCGMVGTKLSKFSLGRCVIGCTGPRCRGKRNRSKGQRHQSVALKDAAKAEGRTMQIAPTHEEQARLLLHYESKSGDSLPKGMRGETIRKMEQQARAYAERQVPAQKWALVFTFPGRPRERRIWMDFSQFLSLVSELQELP